MRGLSAARAAARRLDDHSIYTTESNPAPTFYDKVKDARRRAQRYLSLLPAPTDEELWKKVGKCMKGVDPGAQSRELWVRWTSGFKDKKYCKIVWDTFYHEKRKLQKDNAPNVSISQSASNASFFEATFSVAGKQIHSLHRRICKQDSTKLVSKQKAVKTKQQNIREGRLPEDTTALPNFQKLLRRTVTNFFRNYALPDSELVAINQAKKMLNLQHVRSVLRNVDNDDVEVVEEEVREDWISHGIFLKLLQEKLGVPVTSQVHASEVNALVRSLSKLSAKVPVGHNRVKVGDLVEVRDTKTEEWYRATVEHVRRDETCAVVLQGKMSVIQDDRETAAEVPMIMKELNRKCMWRARVTRENMLHFMAVSVSSFLDFIGRSDDNEKVKQTALAQIMECVRELKILARDVLRAASKAKKEQMGDVPAAPALEIVRLGEDTAWQMMTQLRLHWQAAILSDAVHFMLIETCGTDGTKNINKTQWHTMMTDPPNPNLNPSCSFLVEGLSPGASYTFRIRAFNQHGASAYTLRTFTTLPAPPPIPIVVQLAPTKLMLTWRLDKNNDVAKLKRIFNDIDTNNTGRVSKMELLESVQTNLEVKQLLTTRGVSRKVVRNMLSLSAQLDVTKSGIITTSRNDRQNYHDIAENSAPQQVSVLDCLMANDRIDLSRKEFLSLFGRPERDTSGASLYGIPQSQISRPPESVDSRNRQLSNYSFSPQHQKYISANKKVKKTFIDLTDLQYIVQRLDNRSQQWRDLCTSRKTSTNIMGVQPGERWAYRVVSVNRVGQRSVPSESIVVAQPLPRPPPPQQAPGRSIADTAVVLSLRADSETESKASKVVGTANRMAVSVEDILKRWQMSGQAEKNSRGGNDGDTSKHSNLWGIAEGDHVGQTLEAVFRKFDRDGNGSINASELRVVLLELGAPAGEAELKAAMERMDMDNDGTISKEEFANWWKQDCFDFVLWRDSGIPAVEVHQMNSKHLVSSLNNETGDNNPNIAARNRRFRSRNMLKKSKGMTSSLRSHGGNFSESKTNFSNGQIGLFVKHLSLKLPRMAKGGTCFLSYRGQARTPLVTGLRPNTLYRFRLQVFKNSINSLPSSNLAVMTSPQRVDSGPILLEADARSLRIKWTPAFTGAYAFRVHIWFSDGGSWETVWQGFECMTELTGLSPQTQYRLRVVALNIMGGVSEPSDTLQVTTLSIPEGIRGRLSLRRANQRFYVPCTGDVVVGDTILFRETIPYREIQALGKTSCAKLSGSFLRRAKILLSSEYTRGWVRTLVVRVVAETNIDRNTRKYQNKSSSLASQPKLLSNSRKKTKNYSNGKSKNRHSNPMTMTNQTSSKKQNSIVHDQESEFISEKDHKQTNNKSVGIAASKASMREVELQRGQKNKLINSDCTVVGALLQSHTNVRKKGKITKNKTKRKIKKKRLLHMQVVLCEVSSEDRLNTQTIKDTGDTLGLLSVNGVHSRDEKRSVSNTIGDGESSHQQEQLSVDYGKLWTMQFELARAHILPEGSRIVRTEGQQIYQFEVFRAPWVQEHMRIPYLVDWKARQEWQKENDMNRKAIEDSAARLSNKKYADARKEKRSLVEERHRCHRLEENELLLRQLIDDLLPVATLLEAATSPRSPRLADHKRVDKFRRILAAVRKDKSQQKKLLQEALHLQDRFDLLMITALEAGEESYNDDEYSMDVLAHKNQTTSVETEKQSGSGDEIYGDEPFYDSTEIKIEANINCAKLDNNKDIDPTDALDDGNEYGDGNFDDDEYSGNEYEEEKFETETAVNKASRTFSKSVPNKKGIGATDEIANANEDYHVSDYGDSDIDDAANVDNDLDNDESIDSDNNVVVDDDLVVDEADDLVGDEFEEEEIIDDEGEGSWS